MSRTLQAEIAVIALRWADSEEAGLRLQIELVELVAQAQREQMESDLATFDRSLRAQP